MKTILSIEAYFITQKEIWELGNSIKNRQSQHFFKLLPEWCIRDDNGRIDHTEYYHQFTGQVTPELCSEDKGYIFFDVQPIDGILQEEISNAGLDQFFVEIDFRPLFKKIKVNPASYNMVQIPKSTHLIVDLTYEGEYEDCELFVTLDGYLDYNLNKCEI